jgi:hypothetical protein
LSSVTCYYPSLVLVSIPSLALLLPLIFEQTVDFDRLFEIFNLCRCFNWHRSKQLRWKDFCPGVSLVINKPSPPLSDVTCGLYHHRQGFNQCESDILRQSTGLARGGTHLLVARRVGLLEYVAMAVCIHSRGRSDRARTFLASAKVRVRVLQVLQVVLVLLQVQPSKGESHLLELADGADIRQVAALWHLPGISVDTAPALAALLVTATARAHLVLHDDGPDSLLVAVEALAAAGTALGGGSSRVGRFCILAVLLLLLLLYQHQVMVVQLGYLYDQIVLVLQFLILLEVVLILECREVVLV